MPLQIEVGKRYRTRSGDVVEITKDDGHAIWPFNGIVKSTGHESCWGKQGQWVYGEANNFDLIEELPAYDEHGLTADDYYTGISYPNG